MNFVMLLMAKTPLLYTFLSEYVTRTRYEDNLKKVLHFLVSKDNSSVHYVSLLIIEDNRAEIVSNLIESEKQHDISFIKVSKPDNSIICLWW